MKKGLLRSSLVKRHAASTVEANIICKENVPDLKYLKLNRQSKPNLRLLIKNNLNSFRPAE
jgi:hypothetical protein